ncbi:Trp operon leader peptide [Vibrio splendidus]|uniref:Trp operon leader peptide n=1 Tax=Vibrio splendidus TaxID=29497 RepID=A0ABD5A835_VIBSP|nr:Trp operon leader peptide [Vibrio splendidus]MDP2489249.1 Trp operon leader peptide [Vibrio splendidus]PMO49364.1 Trp operon leader peptide [Vibrio splendidus]
MLQEFNQNHKDKVLELSSVEASSELNWWCTWTSSWWANVYF